MDQKEDWDATKEFEEMEAMDALDDLDHSRKQKPREGKVRTRVITIVSSAVAAAAIVLCVVMAADSLGFGNVSSSVTREDLAEADTAGVEDDNIVMFALNGDLTVTNGGASTPIEEEEEEEEEKEEEEKEEKEKTALSGDYIFPDSNSRYLMDSELSGLSKDTLRLARNEIYARHGYIFGNAELREYFEGKSWYEGTVSASDFSESVFNQFEKANINKIQSYE